MLRAALPAMVLLVLSPAMADAAVCRVESGERVVPLVELYTSEGCSDCPAADAWLAEAARREGDAAHFLAFHVDYWDSIGWPDRFADSLYTQRQNLRVSRTGSRVVYTPQVMIGDATRVRWRGGRSAGGEAVQLLEKLRARRAPVRMRMTSDQDAGAVRVTLELEGADASIGEAWAWVAAYEDGLASTILAGENKGRQLRHDRVVRAMEGPWKFTGDALTVRTRLVLPADLEPRQAGIVAFVESPSNGALLQSLGTPMTACGGE